MKAHCRSPSLLSQALTPCHPSPYHSFHKTTKTCGTSAHLGVCDHVFGGNHIEGETPVDWSTSPAWVCSILQLQASRGQGVPAGAADSNSMDSRFPGCSSKPPSWQRLQAQHCTPATHLKYRIDRQQQSCPWVLRSNVEGPEGARCRSWRKCVNQSTAARPPPVVCCAFLLNCLQPDAQQVVPPLGPHSQPCSIDLLLLNSPSCRWLLYF